MRELTEQQKRFLDSAAAVGEDAGLEVARQEASTPLRKIAVIWYKDASTGETAFTLHLSMDARAFGGCILYPGETADEFNMPNSAGTAIPERRILGTFFENTASVEEVLDTIRGEVAKVATLCASAPR